MQGGAYQKTGFRVAENRLSWPDAFLPIAGGVQAGAGCLAVMDMGAKVLLWEEEQAENL